MYNRMADPGETKSELPEQQMTPPAYSQPTVEQPQPGYPPQQQGGYPPQQQGGYAPQQQGGYPPQQQGGYPPQPAYPAAMHSSNTNTTVVIQQPQAQIIVQGPRDWTTGICSCFDDCGVCLLGILCPCILECTLSGNAGECCCVASACPIALRTKIRTRHNIQGSIMEDCCMIACCHWCAICQMAREVNIHGI